MLCNTLKTHTQQKLDFLCLGPQTILLVYVFTEALQKELVTLPFTVLLPMYILCTDYSTYNYWVITRY